MARYEPIFEGGKKRTKRYPQSGALTPNARGQRTNQTPEREKNKTNRRNIENQKTSADLGMLWGRLGNIF